MNQKTISGATYKVEGKDSNSESSGLEFLNLTSQETNLKNLDQALHNTVLGMELVSVVESACDEVEAILSVVKQWLSLASTTEDSDGSQKAILKTRTLLKLKELDKVEEAFTFKGQKLLDGSLSASKDTDTYSYLMVGTNGSPENRINLNTSLNIPPINSKTLGLGALFIDSSQSELKEKMILENALGIIGRINQRSGSLQTNLQEIQAHLDTAVENHRAANSSPSSYEHTREFLQVTNCFTKNK